MNALRDALLERMRTASPRVTWARAPDALVNEPEAPDESRGTYAVARISFHPREDGISQLLDLIVDVYSQSSSFDCIALAEALSNALHEWQPPGCAGRLRVGDIQDVPADQNDLTTSRMTLDVTGVWVSASRISALTTGGVS